MQIKLKRYVDKTPVCTYLKFCRLGFTQNLLEKDSYESEEMEILKEYLIKSQLRETDFEHLSSETLLNKCISNCVERRCKIRLICAVSPT